MEKEMLVLGKFKSLYLQTKDKLPAQGNFSF